jgi:hypothetical protein
MCLVPSFNPFQDYDDEKLENIEKAKELFLINVANVTPLLHKRIVGVVPVSCK